MVPVSQMTYSVSGVALSTTYSLAHLGLTLEIEIRWRTSVSDILSDHVNEF